MSTDLGSIGAPPMPLTAYSPPPGAEGSKETETVRRVIATVVDGVVSKSHLTTDQAMAANIANSLALSMGLAAAELMSPADVALLLKAVQSKVEQSMIALSKTDIERIQQEQKDQAEARLATLAEQIENTEKANKSGDIGKIFSWIAAALMTVAGAILIATGVAAGAGAALLIGGVAMMVALALQTPNAEGVTPMDQWINKMAETFAANGLMTEEQAQGLAVGIAAAIFVAASAPAFIFAGPAGGIAVLGSLLPLLVTPDQLMKMGMKEEEAQKLSLGLTIGMAVAAIAVTAGPALASGVSRAAASLSKMVANISDDVSAMLAKTASKAASFSDSATRAMGPISKIADRFSNAIANRLGSFFELSSETMQIIGRGGGYTAQIGQAAATVGSGAAQGAAVAYGVEANEARAEEKMLDAFLQNLSLKFGEEKDRLEKLIRQLLNFEPIADMMQSTFEAASFVERHS